MEFPAKGNGVDTYVNPHSSLATPYRLFDMVSEGA